MINRSGLLIGHKVDFYQWLQGSCPAGSPPPHGISGTIYLIPACENDEEAEEVVEDIFEMIFQRELRTWHPNERGWPDTADFVLFTRWFAVEAFTIVEDLGRGPIENDAASDDPHW